MAETGNNHGLAHDYFNSLAIDNDGIVWLGTWEDGVFKYNGSVWTNYTETHRQGRITKRGSKLGRTTLVQCTLIAIRYSPVLKSFYERIKAKKGSGKAIIATSKKLLNVIYMTLKNDIVFEDFANGVVRTT